MGTLTLRPEPLTREAFASFGDVIETGGAESFAINEGTATRFHDLAHVDVAGEGGRPLISILRAQPRGLPFTVRMMERHPLGSQAFIPLAPARLLVLAAPAGDPPRPEELRLFATNGRQGVNFRKGVWHHPLLTLDRENEFLVIDRGGPGENYDEAFFDPGNGKIVIVEG
ncbi:MAG: ureidoglycolate lyase [Alphaproteobacteria bacterium]